MKTKTENGKLAVALLALLKKKDEWTGGGIQIHHHRGVKVTYLNDDFGRGHKINCSGAAGSFDVDVEPSLNDEYFAAFQAAKNCAEQRNESSLLRQLSGEP